MITSELNAILLAFLNQQIIEKNCVFYKHKIKVYISYFRQCPGDSTPSLTHLPVSFSVVPEVTHKARLRALEGCCVRGQELKYVVRRYEREQNPSNEESLIYPPGKSMTYYKMHTENN